MLIQKKYIKINLIPQKKGEKSFQLLKNVIEPISTFNNEDILTGVLNSVCGLLYTCNVTFFFVCNSLSYCGNSQ